MKNTTLLAALLFLTFMTLTLAAAVEIPPELHVTVRSVNSTGSARPGTFDFQFTITQYQNCSSPLYINTATLQTDSQGYADHYLSNVDLPFDEQYFLCYYRDGQLLNVRNISRVPAAFNAKNVSWAGVSGKPAGFADGIDNEGGNSSFNQSLTDSLYASITINPDNRSWNQTLADILYAPLSLADNRSWNQTLADSLYSQAKWGYNQTTPAISYCQATFINKGGDTIGVNADFTFPQDNNILIGSGGTISIVSAGTDTFLVMNDFDILPVFKINASGYTTHVYGSLYATDLYAQLNITGGDLRSTSDRFCNATSCFTLAQLVNVASSVNVSFNQTLTDSLYAAASQADNRSWNQTLATSLYMSRADWTTIDNYPSACPAGQYVTQVNDTLICGEPNATGGGAATNLTNVSFINKTETWTAPKVATGMNITNLLHLQPQQNIGDPTDLQIALWGNDDYAYVAGKPLGMYYSNCDSGNCRLEINRDEDGNYGPVFTNSMSVDTLLANTYVYSSGQIYENGVALSSTYLANGAPSACIGIRCTTQDKTRGGLTVNDSKGFKIMGNGTQEQKLLVMNNPNITATGAAYSGLQFSFNTFGRPELEGIRQDGVIEDLLEFRSGSQSNIFINAGGTVWSNNKYINMLHANNPNGNSGTVPMMGITSTGIAEIGPSYSAVSAGVRYSVPRKDYFGAMNNQTSGYWEWYNVVPGVGGRLVARIDNSSQMNYYGQINATNFSAYQANIVLINATNITLGASAQANHGLCWRSDRSIGYCSDALNATGECTCNAVS